MALLTGALASPKNKAFSVPSFKVVSSIPTVFGVVPKQLDVWGNTTWGDCVSAEEAAAKAMYSNQCGLPETFITADTITSWARQHGYLNGAVITEVMDTMISTGITSAGVNYKDGQYSSVDWTDSSLLSAAIYQGPVKLGVAAGQLQKVYQPNNGWWGTGFHQNKNTDHCTNVCGYGTADALADLMKSTKPSSLNGGTICYLLFTWGSIGIIDEASLNAITDEAWLRNPTTVGQAPAPAPIPTPIPVPIPPPGPIPVYPFSGSYQVGVYNISWTATLNDPPPLP